MAFQYTPIVNLYRDYIAVTVVERRYRCIRKTHIVTPPLPIHKADCKFCGNYKPSSRI